MTMEGVNTLLGTDGDFIIKDNPALESIVGFESMLLVAGSFHIQNNDLLTDISAFGNFETIQKNMVIQDNQLLSSLTGFSALERIYDMVIISNNPMLSSIDGLQNLDPAAVGFITIDINNNTSLNNFCALEGVFAASNESSIFLTITDNLYNPTFQNIVDGNCSQ